MRDARVALFTIDLNRENGDWCCKWLDDLRHKHDFLCFYALQETDNGMTSAMNVSAFFEYGRDHGRTAIFVPTRSQPLSSFMG